MFTSAAAVLLISDAFEFSWRYQLPALITLPPAAALALTALFTHRREGPGEPPVTAPAPGGQTDMAAHAVPGPADDGGGQGHGNGQELPQARDRAPAHWPGRRMRAPRATGTPAAAGSPAPVGHPAAETPAPAGHPAAGSPVPAGSPAARTPSGVIPGSRPAEGDGHPAGERGPE